MNQTIKFMLILQLRLDFINFAITGPQTQTAATFGKVTTKNGNPSTAASATAIQSTASQCLTDTFSVSTSGGGGPPVICGENTGEHSMVILLST